MASAALESAAGAAPPGQRDPAQRLPEVFRNAEFVLIFSGHMAHAVFDKGTAFLRKNEIPYG